MNYASGLAMIIGTVRFLPPPDRRAAVIELLRSVQGRVRAQPGCAAFDVLDDQGAEPAIVLFERWDSQAALEEHLRSDAYRRVIAAIELSGGPPHISFEHVESVEGLELVERLRNPQAAPAGGQAPAKEGRGA